VNNPLYLSVLVHFPNRPQFNSSQVYDTQSGIASLHFPDDKQVLLKVVLLEPVGTNRNSNINLAKEVDYGHCALNTSEMLSWLTCHNHQISDRVESCAAGLGSIVVRTERRNARHC